MDVDPDDQIPRHPAERGWRPPLPVDASTAEGRVAQRSVTWPAMVAERIKGRPAGCRADRAECGDQIAVPDSAVSGFISGQNIVHDGGVSRGLFWMAHVAWATGRGSGPGGPPWAGRRPPDPVVGSRPAHDPWRAGPMCRTLLPPPAKRA
jgi:hypothetical protein